MTDREARKVRSSSPSDGNHEDYAADTAARETPSKMRFGGIRALLERWQAHAALLRRYRFAEQAHWLEDRADEVARALEEDDAGLVNLTEAARISGYSPDHLGRLVRTGSIENHGRPRAPRVRCRDLPRKLSLREPRPRPQLLGASKRQVAQAILTSEKRG